MKKKIKGKGAALLGLLLSLGLFLGCAGLKPRQSKPKGNLLLITIDTLRADHLGCYGYSGVKTPHIDRLAQEGVTFTKAITPVPITLPSHTTIMTGLYPLQTGVRDNGTCRVSKQTTTLAEILRQQGFHTGAFVSAYVLDSRYGLDQGFDFYDDTLSSQEQLMMLYNERKAEEVTQAALTWINQQAGSPFFVWIHYFDPHGNYQPPSPFAELYAGHPYDGEIAYTDHWIGVLTNRLAELNLLDNTLIALTADHGEGLGEHGELSHATFIYESTLHVPLILCYPQELPSGQRYEELASTLDLMPTLLSLLSLPAPPCAGIDLSKTIQGDKKDLQRQIYCETLFPEINHGWSPLEGLRTKEWKYIKAPKSELYYLNHDPAEIHNLIDPEDTYPFLPQEGIQVSTTSSTKETRPIPSPGSDQPPKGGSVLGHPTAEILNRQMISLKKELMKWSAPEDTHLTLDQETTERLRSLGYVWTTKDGADLKEALPDPKDMLSIHYEIDRAAGFIQEGAYEKAKEILFKIAEQNPQDIFVRFLLGRIYVHQGLYELAEQEFLSVIKINPEYGDAKVCLGNVYLKLGSYEQALPQFSESLTWHADQYEIFYNLGLTYSYLGQDDLALSNLQKALNLKDNQPEIYNNLGVILSRQGKIEEAILAYQKTIELDPGHPKPYQNLASLYEGRNQWEEATLVYRQLLAKDASHLQAMLSLATALGKQGKPDAAIEAYEQVLDIDPHNVQAHFNLGVAYSQMHYLTEAVEAYEQVLSQDPAYLEAYLNLGVIYQQLGNLDLAKDNWQKILQYDPNHAKAFYNLGNLALSQKNFPEAVNTYQKAVAGDPNLVEAHFGLGAAYIQQGQEGEAVREWEETVRLKSDSVEARVNLAIAYINRGDFSRARLMLSYVLQIQPALPIAHQLIAKINELER